MTPASSTDDLFRALADPTRRGILDLLAEHGSLSVGELAAAFPELIPSGISKHLMYLRAAGLVRAERDGRRRLYRLEADAMSDALTPWLAKYEPVWAAALDRLRELAEDEAQSAEREARSDDADVHSAERDAPSAEGDARSAERDADAPRA
jgi:DNA-binding transcriptional ArsR family regulator